MKDSSPPEADRNDIACWVRWGKMKEKGKALLFHLTPLNPHHLVIPKELFATEESLTLNLKQFQTKKERRKIFVPFLLQSGETRVTRYAPPLP
jgi:hypothetical protein